MGGRHQTNASIYAAKMVPKGQAQFFREADTFLLNSDDLLVMREFENYGRISDFYGGVGEILVIRFDERSQNRVSPITSWLGQR